jgi:hypothetical protein
MTDERIGASDRRYRGSLLTAVVLILAISLGLGLGPARAADSAVTPLDSKSAAQTKYDAFKVRVQSGDLAFDWRAFRLAAAVVAAADTGFDEKQAAADALKALSADDAAGALSGAKLLIQHNMAASEGHIIAWVAYAKLNQREAATREKAILDALVDSIRKSGDGAAAATAWYVVSVDEEYFYLGFALKAKTQSQALVRRDGHSYDQITLAGTDGSVHIVWFLADVPLQIEASQLQLEK